MSNGRFQSEGQRTRWILDRARELGGIQIEGPPRTLRDTSNFMTIDRGDVLDLDDHLYLVRGNEVEGRFGIDDQPKYWVKHVLSLETGRVHIIKLVFHESFNTQVAGRDFECTRSAEKEAQVLAAVGEHDNFMHGRSVRDEAGNLVRILDFIEGDSLLKHMASLTMPHERYVETLLPRLLAEVHGAFAGIAFLHRRNLCHGDIRNDHLLMDQETHRARWIDFDFERNSLVFDVWGLGNVLNCVVAKGFVTFHTLRNTAPELLSRISEQDASVFFKHRVMNVHKIYPHVPTELAAMLSALLRGRSRALSERRRGRGRSRGVSSEVPSADWVKPRPASSA